MKHDFGWVCDELARLHTDLEAIRARKRAESMTQSATAAEAKPEAEQVTTPSPLPDDSQAGELDLAGLTEGTGG